MTKAKVPAAGNMYDRFFSVNDPHRTLVDQIDAGKYIIGRAHAGAAETDFLWQIWTLEMVGTQPQITYASDGEPRFRWVDRELVTDPNLPDDGSPAGIFLTREFVDSGSLAGTTVGFLYPMAKDVGIETYVFEITNDPSDKFALGPATNNQLLLTDTAFGIDGEYLVEIKVTDSKLRSYTEWLTINVANIRLTNNSIIETAPLGAKIADIIAVDGQEPIVISILDDPDQKFQVSGVELLTNDAFDFSDKESHQLTLQTTDALSVVRTQTFTIEVLAENISILESLIDIDAEGNPAMRVIVSDKLKKFQYNEVSHTGLGELIVLTYTVSAGIINHLLKVQCSGENRSIYTVEINGNIAGKARAYYTEYNASIDLDGITVEDGDVVVVKVDSKTNEPADFNATLTYEEHAL